MLGDKMYPYMSEYLQSIIVSGRIEFEDIRAIRTVLTEETAIDRGIVEALLAVDRAVNEEARWRAFLAETVADFAVWVEHPLGQVTAETSAWLIGALRGPDGAPAPSAGAIVHAIIAEAEETDTSLTLFALSMPGAASWARPDIGAQRPRSDFVM